MRTSVGKSLNCVPTEDVFQLLTAMDRFLEHLESLFLNKKSLSDGYLLRQGREASWRLRQCQRVDIDGFSGELLETRGEQSYEEEYEENSDKDWLSRFHSADAIIFVVPLSAYCLDHPASASLVSGRSALSCCIVR